MPAGLTYVADHTLLLALPALAPAVVVAGVVLYIALKDRQKPDDPDDSESGGPAS